MNHQIADVADALLAIEVEMRQAGYWSSEAPSQRALSSVQPFCIDTLTFPEWLQFVFMPKMAALVEQGGPFPRASGIAPMAEEYFTTREPEAQRLVDTLRQMDELLTD